MLKTLLHARSSLKLLNIYLIIFLIFVMPLHLTLGYDTSGDHDISLDLERDTLYRRLCSTHGYPNSTSIGSATWLKVDYVSSNATNFYVQLYLIVDDVTFYSDTSNYVGESTGYLYVDAIEVIHKHHHIHNGITICSYYRYTVINN